MQKGKKVIVANFDNVLLDQGPLHAYCAFKAFKEVAKKGLLQKQEDYRPWGVFGTFFKNGVKVEDFLPHSPISKSFFVRTFSKFRHLARADEDYLGILVFIEKNIDKAVCLSTSANFLVYNASKEAIHDETTNVILSNIVEPVSNVKVAFWEAFRKSAIALAKENLELFVRLCAPEPETITQLRKVANDFPLYFVTMGDPKFVSPITDTLRKIGCLNNEDLAHTSQKPRLTSLYEVSMNWEELIPRKHIISDTNVLSCEQFGASLVGVMQHVSAKEQMPKADVWFLTSKMKQKNVRELFETGFVRPNLLYVGPPLVNIFIIATRNPFQGQYAKDVELGARVLQYDKFAEQLALLASK